MLEDLSVDRALAANDVLGPDRADRERSVPIPGSMTRIPGYPSKLVVYRIAASQYWQVRCWVEGKTRKRSTKTTVLATATAAARGYYEQWLVEAASARHMHAAVLRQDRWNPVPSGFDSEEQLSQAAKMLISLAGKRIDLAQPFASANLEKVRVHAMLASSVNSRTHLSIRVHASREVALQQWLSVNRVSSEVSARLREVVTSKESFLISGSAGAGKTTLLRALLCEVESERIITIEDTAELQLGSKSCVSLVAREANIEGRGKISLNQLLIESLRMRPDRLVIGEVRSAELITLLQASSSGHSAAATIHAASIEQVPARIESIAIGVAAEPKQVVRLAVSSIRWLVHISNADGRRSIEIRRNG
jgi:pilus assembly protein CpaF